MSVKWKYVKPLRNGEAVDSYCEEMGVMIPARLASFLKEHNGGRPMPCTFDTDRRGDYVFNSLYSYNREDAVSIWSVDMRELISSGMYPVGIEATGNVICYDLSNKRLVLWEHESGDFEIITISSNPDLFEGMP